jgi:polyisoprenoid-binding protein YceI
MRPAALLLAFLAAGTLGVPQETETWSVDPTHSTATFTIRHFTTNFVGRFGDLQGTIRIDRANPGLASVEFTIPAASIDTGNPDRDQHLRSADFLDVANHPLITFRSVSVTQRSASDFDVTGDLTFRGVTRRLTLPVVFGGVFKTPGGQKAGFGVETTINRGDYGLAWNRALDAGDVLGEEVKISINLEFDRKGLPESGFEPFRVDNFRHSGYK